MLGDRGVLGLFVLAPVLYAFFYPQPYLGQLVRNIPIAVVDQDNTELSRGLIQALGAHGNLSIALRAATYTEAEDAIQARRAFGIVGIPPDTERNVLKGVQARLPIYADFTYFILFNRTLQGILESVQAAGDRRRHRGRPPARRRRAGRHRGAIAGRSRDGAAVQPDRVVFQLRRAGRLCADPAPDPADGRGDARRHRL